jgi:hypothetical protein
MMAPLIKKDEILVEGRAQYITLHLPDSSELSIVNVYAPRASRDRAPLWKKISKANLLAKHIILGGNFNHFKKEEGIRGQAGERRMHRREAATWHHLTLQYGLLDAWNLDSFRRMSKKEYTYDNGRKGQGSAVSRIDKFLVSQKLESKGRRIESAPSIRKISNHSPLKLTVWGHTSAPSRTATFFDITLLKEDESRRALLEAWEGTQPPPNQDADWPGWLKAATERVLNCNGKLAKERKREKGARTRGLQYKIRLAEIRL